MKKKKKFINKSMIKWKKFDIIFFSIIFIFSSRFIFIDASRTFGIYCVTNNIMVWLIWTIFLLFVILINSIPGIIIYLAIRGVINKYNKSRVTFDANIDLEYYREKFNGISPATMSLLMDLSLESNKDLGAMKLYYELNQIYYYIKDGSIYLNNPNNIKINKSDEILLKCFFENKYDLIELNEWKENVICETVNSNLIVRNKKKKKIGCGPFIFFHLLAFGYIVYYAFGIQKHMDMLDFVIENYSSDMDALTIIAGNPEYIVSFVLSLGLAVALLVYFWSIISGFIHFITKSIVSSKDKFKRTNEGNILTEKLYGMRNFIRDFSNLDEATRNHIVLWKDFLIYAIVLEENDIILKEISNIYHTDLLSYKNYK